MKYHTIHSVSALTMRKNFGKVIDRVAKEGEHITITRGGRALVTLIPSQEYERAFSQKNQLETLNEALNRLDAWQEQNTAVLQKIRKTTSAEDAVRAIRNARCS